MRQRQQASSFIFSGILLYLFLADPAWAQNPANTAKELYSQGQKAFDQGDVNKAIELFERSIELDPDLAPAYSALASVYLSNNGQLNDIIWLFEQAAALEPKNIENYTSMCRAYFQFREPDKAEAACRKALSIDPNSGSAQLALAWVYLLGKVQPRDAIYYFNEVLKKAKSPKIYYGLGMAYGRNNDFGRVLEIVTKLRGMGEETLASQLEKMIRRGEAGVPQEEPLPAMGAGPSQVVGASPQTKEASAPRSEHGSIGTQRIQLRGKIIQSSAYSQAQGTQASETGENESSNMQGHESSARERLEKVRQIRGYPRTSHATGTVSIQGGSGTGTVQITPPSGP